jgi:hypothetical protein
MARTAASGRLAATGRSALAHPQRVVNFANSLRLIGASNQIGVLTTYAGVSISSKTIEFWAKHIIDPTTTTPIWSLASANYYFGFSANTLFQSYSDSGSVQRTAGSAAMNVRQGSWNHYAYTVDLSGSNVTIRFYLNGVQTGSDYTNTTGMLTSYGGTIILGAFAGSSLNYTGFITGLKFYNRALTAAEMLSRYRNYQISSGLVDEWNFTEGSGANLGSSGGHTFALANSPTWEPNVVPLKSRSAA